MNKYDPLEVAKLAVELLKGGWTLNTADKNLGAAVTDAFEILRKAHAQAYEEECKDLDAKIEAEKIENKRFEEHVESVRKKHPELAALWFEMRIGTISSSTTDGAWILAIDSYYGGELTPEVIKDVEQPFIRAKTTKWKHAPTSSLFRIKREKND